MGEGGEGGLPLCVTDVQAVCARAMGRRPHNVPSLRRCVRRWLGFHLDKTEQCSDWDCRPLTASQLEYAALDAEVLLQLMVAVAPGGD